MPFYVSYLIQLLLIIHVIKTGRERYWILILLFLPLIGGAAYLITEVLPDFFGGLTGQRATRGVKRLVDPGADVRSCATAWEQSPNAENGRRYSQALLEAGRADDALGILDASLSGFFASDPALLLLKAQAHFQKEEWQETLNSLDRLRDANPDFRSPEGHLLEARALENLNRLDEALGEYRKVAGYFPGAEARYRMARALQATGEEEEAKKEFESILRDARLAPAHFSRSQKPWLKAAKDALKASE